MKFLLEFSCAAAFVLLTNSLALAQADEPLPADGLSTPSPDSTTAADAAVPPPPSDTDAVGAVPAPSAGPAPTAPAPLAQRETQPEALGPRPHAVGAGFAEFGMGLGALDGSLTFTVASIAIGYDSSDGLLVVGLTVGPVLTVGLTSLAIYGGGRMTGGKGSFWWTTLGVLAGAALGGGVGYGLIGAITHEPGGLSNAGFTAGTLLAPALALAGGMFAFERSDRAVRRRSAGPQLVPTVASTQGGLTLGLAGRF